MPVNKPNLIMSGASMHSVKRARDGAGGRSMAQNAAMGLDNFSRLLQNDPAGAQKFMPQGQSGGPLPSSEVLRAAGLENGRPFSGPQHPRQHHLMQQFGPAQLAMQQSSQPLMMARGLQNLNAARLGGSDGAVLAVKSAAHKLGAAAKKTAEVVGGSMGKLSSLFESGREGVAAIGYDRMGGTSYGSYQIASATGTFDAFLSYLDKHAPDYAKKLRKAGEANTGGKTGAVPDAWREIAGRDAEAFEKLQHGFIHERLYTVAARRLGEQGIDEAKLSPALREVLFSTAVQHGAGGAARIVSRAVGEADARALSAPESTPGLNRARAEEQVVRRIYAIRQEQFTSSTPQVQRAVSNRLNSELQMALNMLKTGNIG